MRDFEEFETAMDENVSCRTCASFNAKEKRCDSVETTIVRTWDHMTCRFHISWDKLKWIQENQKYKSIT